MLSKADGARILAAFLCVAAASTLSALGPVALKLLIDTLSGARAPPSTSSLVVAPVVLLGVYVGAQGFSRLAGELRMLLFGGAEQSISRKLFAHVMALPLRFHLQRSTGAIAQTLKNGLQGFRIRLIDMTPLGKDRLDAVLPGYFRIIAKEMEGCPQ